jgi:hypothetical protein
MSVHRLNQAYGSFRKEKTGANKMLKRVKTTWAINEPVLSQDAKEQLPLIECECGAKILLLPDIKEMNRAIEAHVVMHQKMEIFSKKAKITVGRIRQNLAKQVILKAASGK